MISSVAGAAVLYTPEEGGFVGKGDVQLALELDNAVLQAAVQDNLLKFTYGDTVEYDVPCKKENRNTTLRNTFPRSRALARTVQYGARKKSQITGFELDAVSGSTLGRIICGQLSVNGVLLPQ